MQSLTQNTALRWAAVLPAAILGSLAATLLFVVTEALLPRDSVYIWIGGLIAWFLQTPATEEMVTNILSGIVLEPLRAYFIVLFAAKTAPNHRRGTAIVIGALYFALTALIVALSWSVFGRALSVEYWRSAIYLAVGFGLAIGALVLAVRQVSANEYVLPSYETTPAHQDAS